MSNKTKKPYKVSRGPLAGYICRVPFLSDKIIRDEVMAQYREKRHTVHEIADRLGLVPYLVHLVIANNSDPLGSKLRSRVEQKLEKFPGFAEGDNKVVERCPGCGHTVQMPCLACKQDGCR